MTHSRSLSAVGMKDLAERWALSLGRWRATCRRSFRQPKTDPRQEGSGSSIRCQSGSPRESEGAAAGGRGELTESRARGFDGLVSDVPLRAVKGLKRSIDWRP